MSKQYFVCRSRRGDFQVFTDRPYAPYVKAAAAEYRARPGKRSEIFWEGDSITEGFEFAKYTNAHPGAVVIVEKKSEVSCMQMELL